MMDRASRGPTFSSRFGWALTVTLVLPLLGIAGAAVAGVATAGGSQLAQSTRWQIYLLSTAIGILLIGMIIGFMWSQVRSRLRRDLTEYAGICRALAAGDQQAPLPVIGQDDFALLATGINALVMQRDQGGMNSSDTLTLQNQIEKLLHEVSAVGEGDLSIQAEVTPDTLGVLADSFNYMIEELAKVVGRVQSTTQQVILATRRIVERSNDLSRAADAQYAQITQTSTQVETLAAFILAAARNATLSADAADQALTSAHEGEEAVVQTITGMQHIRSNVQETAKKIKRLGERSQEIGDIVRIIADLAEQTNLLALNAAIQSAMAGDNGRGFAVVADEIRLLAERSGEAAKKIAILVKNIQTETQEAVVAMEESTAEVVAGSTMADNAGRALQTISLAVERQTQMVDAIARAANERALTSESVALAMHRISEITRQTSSAMSDTVSSVMYLSELADQLRTSVATFKLPPQRGALNAPQASIAPPPMGPHMIPPPPFGSPTQTGIPALPPGYGPSTGMPMQGGQSGQWNLFDPTGGNGAQQGNPPYPGPPSRSNGMLPGAGPQGMYSPRPGQDAGSGMYGPMTPQGMRPPPGQMGMPMPGQMPPLNRPSGSMPFPTDTQQRMPGTMPPNSEDRTGFDMPGGQELDPRIDAPDR